MRRLLISGVIAVLAFSASAEAKPDKDKQERKAARRAAALQQLNNTPTNRAVVVRNGDRRVSRNYYRDGRRYYPRHRSGTNVAIGIGLGYPGAYGYGYGDPYGYGYAPSYGYGYGHGGGVVADVQLRLARRGYYRGAVDGVPGPRTRAAIAHYEARHGLIADGRIDRRLLRSLGLS